MRTSTRDRVVLPILLPIVMLLVIAAVLFGFSRILLSLTKDTATAIALIVALSIMVVAAVVASRSVVRASSLASMLGAIAGVAMLAGGIALIAVGAGGEKEAGGGPAVTISLTAKGIAFDKTKLSVPAGKPFAIAFDNQDAGIQHDVQVFDNESFTGTPLETGEYYFHCDIHPTMSGIVAVVEGGGGGGQPPPTATPGGGGGGGGGGTATPSTVTAQGLAFSTAEIALPPDAPSTIHFENKDAGVSHDIAIYTDSSLGTNLFRGQIITGPASIDYSIPALKPGTYYFHCEVHPTMHGSVTVG